MFLLGQWKNFEEMELHLSIPELEAILDAAREQEYSRNRFAASLKGIDLDDQRADNNEQRFREVEAQAKAELAGMSKEEYEFNELGLGIELEQEE